MRLGVALFVLTLAAPAAAAHEHSRRDDDKLGWYVPDFAKLQTGGYTGLVTVGLGYSAFDDRWNVTFDYGYVPPSHAGRTVHSVSAAWSYRPFDVRFGSLRLVPLYAGLNATFTFGDGYFVAVPDRYRPYSKTYYPPTGVHWMAHVGVELDVLPHPESFFERHGLYVEARALDTYLISYVNNPGTIGFTEMFASTLGYRAAF